MQTRVLFKRNLIQQLLTWRTKANRLPLILWGARQVGKTTTVEAFGDLHFKKTHTFNFQKTPSLKTVFMGDINPREILHRLGLLSGNSIDSADLVFFDEIQECAEAVTALKYFSEGLPEQAVVAAGSHLGLIRNESAFPVGKVEFLALHPMTYFEFVENLEPQTHEFLMALRPLDSTPIDEFYHRRALHWLRLYLCVGGMPEAVGAFAQLKNLDEPQSVRGAREIQLRLIEGYRSDFSKHSGMLHANHILRVFDAVALQLGQTQNDSVSKFKFSGVIPKKKGFEGIEGPMTWLEKSRLVIKTSVANRFEQPIQAFTKQNHFKAYLFDVGLLNAMLDTPVESLLLEELGSYKGYIAENFVTQELFAATGRPLVAWSEAESEVEFIISRGADLCPIEVKASSRSRSAKSLDALIARYHPPLCIKTTGQNRGFIPHKRVLTLPIYLVARLLEQL